MRPLAAAAIVTLLCGCSFSYHLGSMIGKDDTPPAPPATAAPGHAEVTPANATQAATRAMPSESDLAQARQAVAKALGKGGPTQSTPWENPVTGARGTITPIGAVYSQENRGVCRNFLASSVHDANETWLEGQACRDSGGRWTVKRLTPWKRV